MFVTGFDTVFTAEQITIIRMPTRAPRANAFAERWIGTLRRKCTDRILILGRRHLTAVLNAYLTRTTALICPTAPWVSDHPTGLTTPPDNHHSRCDASACSEA